MQLQQIMLLAFGASAGSYHTMCSEGGTLQRSLACMLAQGVWCASVVLNHTTVQLYATDNMHVGGGTQLSLLAAFLCIQLGIRDQSKVQFR